MLIATPAIGDPRFARSLVFMCAHTPEHAMGIIVNKPMGALRLPDLLEQLGIASTITTPDRPVLNGGPVDRDRGFVLHTDDFYSAEATLDVGSGVAMTATKDVLEAIASPAAPRQAVLALGYAGWGAGQLEHEILANAWLVCDPSDELLFGTDLEGKWALALNSIGVRPERLSALHGQA
jgi:putative transcriptional regulator